MQIAHVTFGGPLRGVAGAAAHLVGRSGPTSRTVVQLSLVLGGTLVAYHYSLLTLLEQLDVQSPLAYVGLVPVFALALAGAYMTPKANEPNIYDRQLDYISGSPAPACGGCHNDVLPHHMSATFWQWRVDLLAVPSSLPAWWPSFSAPGCSGVSASLSSTCCLPYPPCTRSCSPPRSCGTPISR